MNFIGVANKHRYELITLYFSSLIATTLCNNDFYTNAVL